jgi:hypothetical protein
MATIPCRSRFFCGRGRRFRRGTILIENKAIASGRYCAAGFVRKKSFRTALICERIIKMTRALKTLRAVQWSLLASILLYSVLGEVILHETRAVNPTISYLFTTAGVAIVGVIFVVRRTLVLRAAESLAAHPDDDLSLGAWRTGYIATYVLCESLSLFGLILRFMGASLQQSWPFYFGGFVLLFFFRPRQPVSASPST